MLFEVFSIETPPFLRHKSNMNLFNNAELSIVWKELNSTMTLLKYFYRPITFNWQKNMRTIGQNLLVLILSCCSLVETQCL